MTDKEQDAWLSRDATEAIQAAAQIRAELRVYYRAAVEGPFLPGAALSELSDAEIIAHHLLRMYQLIKKEDDIRRNVRQSLAEPAPAVRASGPSVAEQPPPQANDLPAVWDLVMADMKARDAVGHERYGVRLQPHNGRDALRDAFEEALDLVVYLRQAIYERDGK